MKNRNKVSLLFISAIFTIATFFSSPSFSATPPTPVGYYTGGLFSQYFRNMVQSGGTNPSGICPVGYGIVGFSTGTTTFGIPVCQQVSGYWVLSGSVLNYAGGKVGVGTSTGVGDFTVSGSIAADIYLFNPAGVGPITGWDTNFTWTWAESGNIYNLNTGSVGIGKIPLAPYKLDIAGDINFAGGLYQNGILVNFSTFSTGSSQWTTAGSNIYYNMGNVGIGTSNPLRLLSLSGGGIAFQEPNGSVRNIHWGDSNTNTWLIMIAGSATLGNEFLSFNVGPFGANGINRLHITGTGDVGIGTTNPTAKLEVNGNVIAAAPTAASHLTTKAYVDAQVSAGGGKTPYIQTFTSNGTWVRPVGVNEVWVTMIGGGGGGGGGAGSSSIGGNSSFGSFVALGGPGGAGGAGGACPISASVGSYGQTTLGTYAGDGSNGSSVSDPFSFFAGGGGGGGGVSTCSGSCGANFGGGKGGVGGGTMGGKGGTGGGGGGGGGGGTYLGAGGRGGTGSTSTIGLAGVAGSGYGGGGGGGGGAYASYGLTTNGAGGGCSGQLVAKYPVSVSGDVSVTVGGGGAGATAGTNIAAGGAGAPGVVIVEWVQ